MASGVGSKIASAFVELRADSAKLIKDLQAGKASLTDAAKFMARVEGQSKQLKTAFGKLGTGTKETFAEIDKQAKLALGGIPAQFGAVSGAPSNRFVSAMNRNQFAMGQLGFAAQDFIQVMSQPGMGFAAAIRASTNNIQQMLFLMSPLTGAIAGVAVGLGAALVPALIGTSKATRRTTKDIEDQTKALRERAIEDAKAAGRSARSGLGLGEPDSGGGATVGSLRARVSARKGELAALQSQSSEITRMIQSVREGAIIEGDISDQRSAQRRLLEQQLELFGQIQTKAEVIAQLEREIAATEAEIVKKRTNVARGDSVRAQSRIVEIRRERNERRQKRIDEIRERAKGRKDLSREVEFSIANDLQRKLMQIDDLEKERLKKAEKLGETRKKELDAIKEAARIERERAIEEARERIDSLKDRRESLKERLADLGKGRGPSFTSATGLAQSIQQSIGTTKNAERQREKIREELAKIDKSIQKQTGELAEAQKNAPGRIAPGGP